MTKRSEHASLNASLDAQGRAFFEGEGDSWFYRNKKKLDARLATDWPLKLFAQFPHAPKRVLEVGCSNGWRLAEIRRRYGCECVGIDPSAKAIGNGSEKWPGLHLLRGRLPNLPLNDRQRFDLVIVNFVFHWISRDVLLQAVSEVDRVLRNDGLLIIGDFLPDYPSKVPYHHLPGNGLWTFKMDYAKPFTASHGYIELTRATFSHADFKMNKDVESKDRCCCIVLRKTLTELYVAQESPAR